MARSATIREMLTGDAVRLTRAELRVARALMANYPAAGLATIATLANRAEVSDPTVVRLVSKLGFDGFGSFQGALLREVEERMNSPLAMLESRRPDLARGHVLGTFLASAGDSLEATTRMVLPADFDAAVALIGDPRRRVFCLGGRFSRYLAALLRAHLTQIRPRTALIEGAPADQVDRLAELGDKDVLVAFDYRRYQEDVYVSAREARDAGARVVLFTDPWKSPIAALADVVLVAPVEVISPFDTLVPAMAQVEAVIAALVARMDAAARRRLRRIDELSRRHGVVLDSVLPRIAPRRAARARRARR